MEIKSTIAEDKLGKNLQKTNWAEEYLHSVLQEKVVFGDPRRSRSHFCHADLASPVETIFEIKVIYSSSISNFEPSRIVNFSQ